MLKFWMFFYNLPSYDQNILFKIIFMKNTMEWGKTQHGATQATEEQILILNK